MKEQIQNLTDIQTATALVATGAGGSFVQAITEWANIFVAVGNAGLVLGGLYLMYYNMYYKIFSKKHNQKESDEV